MKRYCLSYKNDDKFLGMEITDAINDSVFCEGDTVVVCKKCNAIMHESSWTDNSNICGICEGTKLREINQKYLESYNQTRFRNNENKNGLKEFSSDNPNDIYSNDKKKTKKKHKKVFLIFIILLIIISGIAYASSTYHPLRNDDSFQGDVSTKIPIGDECDEMITAPVVNELFVTQTEIKQMKIDNAFVGDDIYIDEESPKRYSGYISESSPKNVFTFTAQRSGRYNFSIEDMMATASARMQVYDSNDYCIIDTHSKSDYEELSGNGTYRIVISHSNGESDFNLVIGIQKKTVDISNSSIIYDQISFDNQKNKYTFTPKISGRYRFDITEANSNVTFRMMLWDDKDNNLEDTYEDGFYEVLEKGKTYDIQIRQYNGLGSYCLKVGFQKPTTDITGYTAIMDSIEYTDQKNVYMLTAPVSGRYRLDISETNANNKFRLMGWDHLDYEILDTYESGAYVDLKQGETYEFQVRHYSGFGDYTLNIGYQKDTTDISGYEIVHDSITFESQVNNYSFVPNESRRYTFSLSDYSTDCKYRLIILDELENELADSYGGEGTTAFKAGKEYLIMICQYSGYGDYTLNIE